MKIQNSGLALFAVTLLFTYSGCESPYQLTQSSVVNGSSGNPSGSPQPGPQVVCDPFNTGTNQTARNGIKARLTYVDNYQASASHLHSTADYEPGMPDILVASADVYLSKLDVPLRAWDSGFMMSDGQLLKKSDGETLFEGFSLRMGSTFVAPTAADEGDYQLSTISDDGSTVSVDSAGNGQYSMLVNNDGVHGQATACADRTVHLTRGQPLPFKINYFQGPRVEIAMQLLWRKVPAASSGLTCSGSGWTVVPPAAFQLPNDTVNPCAH